MTSQWLNHVIQTVDDATELVRSSRAEFREFGRARWLESDGCYQIERKITGSDLDRLDDAVLATDSSRDGGSYAVTHAEVRDNTLLVRVSAAASRRTDLNLYTPALDPKRMLMCLRECLEALPEGSMADRLGEGALDAVVPTSEQLAPALSAEQRLAVDACSSAGLHAVWGPPGTGKTAVIAAATHRLLARGQRVLLVSSTNVAVDNAVQRVVASLADQDGHVHPGRILRVGTPQVAEVANDTRVALRSIVEARLATQRQHQRDLAERACRLGIDLERLRHRVEASTNAVASFDPVRHAEAMARQRNAEALATAEAAVGAAVERMGRADADLRTARTAELRARFVCEVFEEQRLLERVAAEADTAADVATRTGLSRLLAAGATRRARARYRRAVERASAATEARQATQRALGPEAPATPVPSTLTPEFAFADRGAQTRQAEAAREAVDAEHALFNAHQELAAAEVTRNQRAGAVQPLPSDRQLLEDAERYDLPGQLALLPALTKLLQDLAHQQAQLEAERSEHEAQSERQRREVERDVIAQAQVVATTLTMLTLKSSLTADRFDHVIVDEAAAASLPHVAHAVGLAASGACLVGDFFQNGPLVAEDISKRWRGDERLMVFESDCFTHLGLTDPRTAKRDSGCVVLTEEYRFGPAVVDLANRACYGETLVPKSTVSSEIVILDVDGLPSPLTDVRREKTVAGAWPIGALAARALGELHAERSETVGVVAPHGAQVIQTSKILDDADLGATVDVGTAHRFQGREFDVVVFDTLETGRMPGWVAQGAHGRGRWPLDGLRLFNVAVTRARKRLYVLINLAAINKAKTGPLSHLRALVQTGKVEVVSVGGLLGLGGSPQRTRSPADDDLGQALRPYVRVVGVHDQERVLDAARARIDAAEQSVWLWSPWVGGHATALQESLIAAQNRNVTVRLLALPDGALTTATRKALHAIRRVLDNVVLIRRMHQKILIVDDRWSFVGSMNLLSHGPTPSRRRHEVMVEFENRHFAEQLLENERARQLATPPSCPLCHTRFSEVKHVRRGKEGWYWICAGECRGSTAFVDAKVRLDWRPTSS